MIYVIPGMGADNTMFRDEWRTVENCVFPNWPAYQGERTLRDVAERLVIEQGIQHGDVLVGHSLGGMVACEIATLRKLKLLILLGSASRKEEISGLLATLHPLATITPFRLAQIVAAKLPGNLYEMFVRSDPDFIRATCKAIFEWSGLTPGCALVKRVHGRHDLVIPLPAGVDRIIEGGHMIPLTHSRDCVAYLKSLL